MKHSFTLAIIIIINVIFFKPFKNQIGQVEEDFIVATRGEEGEDVVVVTIDPEAAFLIQGHT